MACSVSFFKVFLVVSVLLIQWEVCFGKDAESKHGPNPNPNPTSLGSSSNGLRNRFPVHFPKPPESSNAGNTGSVKILEALSARSQKVLKRNPAERSNTEAEIKSPPELDEKVLQTDKSAQRRMSTVNDYEDQGDLDTSEESDEVLLSPFGTDVFSKRIGSYSSNKPLVPIAPTPLYNTNTQGSSYGTGSPYGNRPRPMMMSYKPAGGSTLPPIIFPPVPISITTTEASIPIIPEPTSGPVGPPVGPTSPTVVPIIGGGGSGGDIDEDVFPPSPPEIETSVGRSLQLKSSSPRTRISSILSSSREAKGGAGSPGGRRLSGSPGVPGSSSSSTSSSPPRIRTTRLRDRVRESLESTVGDDGEDVVVTRNVDDAENGVDPDVITGKRFRVYHIAPYL
jgi:hypothetical protein